jgi:hypothetical protein
MLFFSLLIIIINSFSILQGGDICEPEALLASEVRRKTDNDIHFK